MQMKIKLVDLNLDLQTRAAMDRATILEYAEKMTEGAEFPPVVIVSDGETHWLADGFHRVRAAFKNDVVDIEAEVWDGDKTEALKKSLAANQAHGLRRTSADKRRCVEMALREFVGYSARQVAELCGVGHQLVDEVRALDESANAPAKVKCKDGREYPAKKPVKKSQVHPESAPVVKFDDAATAELKSAFAPEPGAHVKTADEETQCDPADAEAHQVHVLRQSFLACEEIKRQLSELQTAHKKLLEASSESAIVAFMEWKKTL